MGQFRTRVKGKGRRWKKGHSSSSNPETKRHRDVAKLSFFQDNLGQGNLTSDALKKHDVFLGTENETQSTLDDTESIGTFKTFQTFASDWSQCSNDMFKRLLNGFHSDCALDKDRLAVLAAVTEVIKSNEGKETSTEYFAAFMTILDSSDTEDSATAALSLLGMVIKRVPENVLKLKFSETSKTLMDILTKFAQSENKVLLNSLIGCLSVLLRSQEAAIWSNSSTVQVFDSILAFTVHSKPKVRKAAQHAVCTILRASSVMLAENAPSHHPIAGHVAKFCIYQVESGGSLGGSTTTLHILNLLKDILVSFPKAQLKAACESILKVMTLGNILVTSCGLQALHGLFASHPSLSNLPDILNAQLITALFDYQPAASDTQPTLAWLAVMQEAYINLARVKLTLCFANLPRLFSTVTQLWLSEKPEVLTGATATLEAVVQKCLGEDCVPDNAPNFQLTVSKVLASVEAGLKYQYHSAWHHVLRLLASIFEVAGSTCQPLLTPCLKGLADLRDSEQFTYRSELEYTIGKAVRTMGPEVVLSVIPLQVTGQEPSNEFKRSWMLPVLRDNIQTARLQYFIDYFLPIATYCRRQTLELENKIAAHSYDLLQSQIWALLPCFCNNPSDLKESFKGIAKVLGTAISQHKDLRLSVMASLRKLITRNQASDNQENLSELARFSKNYLPILFNVYTIKPVGSDEEGQRLAALETIKVYLALASPELCGELFDRAYEKLNMEETDGFVKECVLDLLRTLLPYQDNQRLSSLLARCRKWLQSTKNRHEQKKAYRLLEELCSSESESCQAFLNENLPNIKKMLHNSLSKSLPPSKGPRLRCLIHLVPKLEKKMLLQHVVPEAVLCCKAINEKIRASAFILLTEIGAAMQRLTGQSKDEVIKEYVGVVMAGLAGSPALVSSTLLALASITHKFKADIPTDLLQLLTDNVCLLLLSYTREIVVAALSYIKVIITSFPTTTIGPSIPGIVKSLTGMTEDCKRRFRVKCKDILDRLIRKFGYDAISQLVPASDTIMHKRLNNLRKVQAKKKKQQKEGKETLSDDDDDEPFAIKGQPKSIEDILAESDESDMEVDPPKKSKAGSKKKPSAWIQEDADTIVDFTDSSAAKKIRATHPAIASNQVQRKGKSSPFKTTSDGRLIIADDSDSDDDKPRHKQLLTTDADSGGEEEDRMSTAGATNSRKRRLSVSTNTVSEPPLKYQAGGSGIHRPVFKVKSKRKAPQGLTASTGAEYRAKKAKGDVKRKGLPDPFAYVPLSRKVLNKRKKLKHAGQFTNLVRAARKGAKKGVKSKMKSGLKKR